MGKQPHGVTVSVDQDKYLAYMRCEPDRLIKLTTWLESIVLTPYEAIWLADALRETAEEVMEDSEVQNEKIRSDID